MRRISKDITKHYQMACSSMSYTHLHFMGSCFLCAYCCYQGKFSGSFTSLDRMFWFRALMACMSSSERAKFSISRFSAKWLGLARGMVIKLRNLNTVV